LLDGLATMIIDGRVAAEPGLRRVVEAFLGDQVSADDWLQGGLLSSGAAIALWDVSSWAVSGIGSRLRGPDCAVRGAECPPGAGRVPRRLRGGEVAGLEETAIKEVTGARKGSYGALLLAAYRGRPAEASPLIAAAGTDALARGEGLGLFHTNWATAVLHNGLGRYADALPAAEQAADEDYAPLVAPCALSELIEAGVRSGDRDGAADALRRLSATVIKSSDWAAGIEARSRALLNQGRDAEHCFAEAVERLGRTPLRPDLARAHLLCGEWLRREGRRVDARHQLHAAYDLFAAMGAEAFADRARRRFQLGGADPPRERRTGRF
jgi:hypothetical protein